MLSRRQLLAAGLIGVIVPSLGFAQEVYPNRQVTVIVPVAAGGLADMVTRAAAERLAARSGGNFTVEYVVGVGGSQGTQAIADAEPDGYTIGLTTEGLLLVNPFLYENVAYTPSDFAPIGILAEMPLMLLVNRDHPAQTLEEFLAMAAEQPGTMSYGSSGAGTMPHLVMHHIAQSAGVSMVHVPYRGGANSVTDLIGGRLDMLAAGAPLVIGSIGEDGPLRPLAVAGPERLAAFPDLPTVAEAGVPGFAMNNPWWGFIAPAGTPPEIIGQLNEWLALESMTEEERAIMSQANLDPVFVPADEMAARLQAEAPGWEQLVSEMGIRLE